MTTKTKDAAVRTYPARCTSAYCGKVTCPESCPGLPDLRDFKAWRERTGATCADKIWSPLVYIASRAE